MNQTVTSLPILDYKKTIFTLVNELEQLQEFCKKLDLKNESLDRILQKIKTDTFSLAVVGEFNRGKSTFINALMGYDLLPSDILATTAVISRIHYRSTPGAKITFKNGHQQEISFDELANYITKLTTQTEAQAAQLKEVEVYYPVHFCQNNNLEIIDTPGLNDDADMTALTLSVLRQCEMAIVLISPLSPLGISEQEFLTSQLLDNGIHRLIFVVNGIDRFNSKQEIEKVINLIRSRIQNCIQDWAKKQSHPNECLKRIGKIEVYEISALQALKAKQTNNLALLAQNRLINFESSLTSIVSRERGLIRLEITINRVVSSSVEILEAIKSQQNFLELKQVNLRRVQQIITEQISIIRRQKTETTGLIDNINTSIKAQSDIFYNQLANDLNTAAIEVIQASIGNVELQRNLSNKVLDAVQKANTKLVIQFQKKTQQALTIQWQKLQKIGELLEQFILRFDPEIKQLGMDTTIYNRAINTVQSVKKIAVTSSKN